MAFSRRLGVIGILGASWLVAVGCGSDDGKKVNGGGEAGEAGESTGGKASSGGSSNNAGKSGGGAAGKGGTGGTAGKGGTGGTASAGTAGSGGSGGDSTAGGMTSEGGTGGAPESSAGAGGVAESAGAAGAAGSGGVTPPPVAKQCHYQCEVDDDCKVGVDDTQKCNTTTHRCENPMNACQTNDDCIPFGNFLFFTCTSVADCFDGEACVSLHGQGWCATMSDVDAGCGGPDPLVLDNVGSAGTSAVCLSNTARCNAGSCIFGCADPEFGGCDSGTGATCNDVTGLCECAESTECTANGVSSCGTDSHCGCAGPTDCSAADVPGQSTCVAGTCGCADATECPDPGFANAPPVCE
jgi:hypothetical protein